MAPSLVIALIALLAVAATACRGGDSARVTPTPAGPGASPTQPTPTHTPSGSETAATPAPLPDRIRINPDNPRYFSWRGETILPIGATESGPESCENANGWLAISSGFDWQPDLENLLAHGGNFVRVLPYFPGHPIQPWQADQDGQYDLSRINPEWTQRLEAYLAWTEANDIVVLLEVFDNWSFVNDRDGAWQDNPWHPENNVNYDDDTVSGSTTRDDAAIYRAFTEGKAELAPLLEQYVSALLDVALPHGNVIYNVSNESNAPLAWSEHFAGVIRRIAGERGLDVLVGEMPHAFDPSTGLGPIAAGSAFDYVDAASQTSDDVFGDSEAAEVAGTDDVMTRLRNDTGKPVTIGKIYYRSPATLWSKFINGAAAVRYHRNCDRGGSDEANPQAYFDYVRHLRTFTDEIDLASASSTDDGLASDVTPGIRADVLAAPGLWYAVYLYREAGDPATPAQVSLALDAAAYNARWFNPATGEWLAAPGNVVDAAPVAKTLFTTPSFESNLVLLVQVTDGR